MDGAKVKRIVDDDTIGTTSGVIVLRAWYIRRCWPTMARRSEIEGLATKAVDAYGAFKRLTKRECSGPITGVSSLSRGRPPAGTSNRSKGARMFGTTRSPGRRRCVVVAALGAAALLAMSACGSSSPSGDTKAGAKSLHIVSLISTGAPYPASVLKGVEKGIEAAGNVKVENVNTKLDTAEEATAVQNVIAQKPDGVIYMPNDGAAAATLVAKLHDAGIPVLAVHTQVGTGAFDKPDSNLVAFVTQSEFEAGQAAGKLATEALPDGGKVGIVEGSGCCFEAVKDRTEGFLKGVADNGGSFDVVSKQPGAWVTDKSEAACQNMLQSNPDIVLFYAQSDDMAAGCASAVTKAKSSAKVIGIGGSKLGIDGVKAGTIYGSVCYKPTDMGVLAAKTLVDTLRAGKSKADPTFITYTTPAITADNVGDCTPQW
jgi:ABC-type sugar transport system substrate-binding protein